MTPLLSGTCSMNCTCRQFCASSWPVLSYESAVNLAGSPCSWFHSLHATSQALQPMQIDVSVKNPIGFSWNAAMARTPAQSRGFAAETRSGLVESLLADEGGGAPGRVARLVASSQNPIRLRAILV